MKKTLLIVWVCLAIAVALYMCNGEQQKVAVVNAPQSGYSSAAQQAPQVSDVQAENYGDFLNVADISHTMIGKHNVSIVGRIAELKEDAKGHIFTQVKDMNGGQQLQVILWAGTIKKKPEYRNIFFDCWRSQKPVFLKGKIEEYKGTIELIVFEVYVQ